MKENLKPHVYKQSKDDAPSGDVLMACLLKNEPASYAALARLRATRASRSRRESESEQGDLVGGE